MTKSNREAGSSDNVITLKEVGLQFDDDGNGGNLTFELPRNGGSSDWWTLLQQLLGQIS
ncbi:MAG: hypothetical protein R2857_15550 [Vampirovibrionales bacterium]